MHFVNCCLTERRLAHSLINVENDTIGIRQGCLATDFQVFNLKPQECKYEATLLASHDKEVWI